MSTATLNLQDKQMMDLLQALNALKKRRRYVR